jgi:hypothetical protein
VFLTAPIIAGLLALTAPRTYPRDVATAAESYPTLQTLVRNEVKTTERQGGSQSWRRLNANQSATVTAQGCRLQRRLFLRWRGI